ncbi:MAG: aminotransferase class V-fold PLP-dependent enzyme [Gemmatimonadaceae bacterium]
MARPAYDIAAYRAQIPILEHTIPLNNCSQAPLTLATRAAAECFLDSWNRRGMDWEAWMQEVELSRAAFAGMINASPDEVAVVSSVSHAVSVAATALKFDNKRNVIVASGAEFPTVGHVWLAQQARGAQLRWVPLTDGAVRLEDYDRAIDEHTVVVSSAHAFYLNGCVQDVRAIAAMAHDRGALSFVDAYQSLGAVPIDVKALNIDMLASGTLKYLMGTPGIAYLYVRRELIEQLEPLITGWFGRVDPFRFDATTLDWSPKASRFDAGTPPLFSAYVSRAAMQWLQGVGADAIHAWTQHLSQRVIDGARSRGLKVHGPADAQPKAPTTAIECEDSHAVEHALREHGVIGSARGPVIRLAPHFYNTEEDVDRALDATAGAIRS